MTGLGSVGDRTVAMHGPEDAICEHRMMDTNDRFTPGEASTQRTETTSPDIDVRVGHDEIIIRNRYEVLSITNDVLIGLFFVAGSILFLWESTTLFATWLFIIGSVEFLARPLIRLARRFHLKKFGFSRDRSDPHGDY